jgi:hypothetical protein
MAIAPLRPTKRAVEIVIQVNILALVRTIAAQRQVAKVGIIAITKTWSTTIRAMMHHSPPFCPCIHIINLGVTNTAGYIFGGQWQYICQSHILRFLLMLLAKIQSETF